MRVLGALLVATMMLTGCGGGGGGGGDRPPATPPPTPEANVTKIQVGAGPYGVTNLPMVSVTVCAPGNASQCYVIDNVLLDTGSVGLRVVGSVLASKAPNLNLPVVQAGQPAGSLYSCIGFIDGSYAWGGIRSADIKIGGMTASNISIQVIGDTPLSGARPAQCTGIDPELDNSVAANLGANGILGVNYYAEDCGGACITAANAVPWYYTCSLNACDFAGVPLAQQVKNPVAAFPTDNNGLLVQLPGVPAEGSNSVSGSLIFGIGTRANNALGNAHLFDGNELTTRYKGALYDIAFIDSGSNALYFNDATIPRCTDSIFFCPPSPLSLSAVIGDDSPYAQEIGFGVASMRALVNSGNFAFSNLAGQYSFVGQGRVFDWGLPFFFGRTVYFGMENTVYENKVGF
jgi:hypothetical protein